jgi:hypothetical protein
MWKTGPRRAKRKETSHSKKTKLKPSMPTVALTHLFNPCYAVRNMSHEPYLSFLSPQWGDASSCDSQSQLEWSAAK